MAVRTDMSEADAATTPPTSHPAAASAAAPPTSHPPADAKGSDSGSCDGPTGPARFRYFPGLRLTCVVTGAAGFIGGHLGAELRRQGHRVVGADRKLPEDGNVPVEESCDAFVLQDLRSHASCAALLDAAIRVAEADGDPGADPGAGPGAAASRVHVFHLAADMGGMGFIQSNHAACLLNNGLMDLHVLEACRSRGVARLFYASSACVYPEHLQGAPGAPGLREADAWPAAPQDAYGLEKLFAEEACRRFARDFGTAVRVARFHNVYGPRGTWRGGREKFPAALCRKVAVAGLRREKTLEIWGDGKQTRSFVYVDDLVDGVLRLMACDDHRVAEGQAVNLGTEESVSVDDLARTVFERQVGGTPDLVHRPDGPQGVRGRNSDNDLMREVLDGWEPPTSLAEGMHRLYDWVDDMVYHARRDGLGDMRRSEVVPTGAPAPLGEFPVPEH